VVVTLRHRSLHPPANVPLRNGVVRSNRLVCSPRTEAAVVVLVKDLELVACRLESAENIHLEVAAGDLRSSSDRGLPRTPIVTHSTKRRSSQVRSAHKRVPCTRAAGAASQSHHLSPGCSRAPRAEIDAAEPRGNLSERGIRTRALECTATVMSSARGRGGVSVPCLPGCGKGARVGIHDTLPGGVQCASTGVVCKSVQGAMAGVGWDPGYALATQLVHKGVGQFGRLPATGTLRVMSGKTAAASVVTHPPPESPIIAMCL